MESNNNEVKNKKLLFILIGGIVLLLIPIIFFSSYAFFSYIKEGTSNTINTGKVYLNLDDKNNSIYLSNRFPISDSEAYNMSSDGEDITFTEFTVTGYYTGNEKLKYKLSAVKGEETVSMTRFPDEHVKIYLSGKTNEFGSFTIENGFDTEDSNQGIYGTLGSNGNSGVDTSEGGEILLATGEVDSEETVHTYKLKMWITDSINISDTESSYTYCASERACNDDRNVYAKMYYSLKLKVESMKIE